MNNNNFTGLTIRGDSLYCPLSFSLDSYSNCDPDCLHCYIRRLNYTWDRSNRSVNVELLEKKLVNGLNNKNPRSALSFALKNKKTIRFGNKSDPFQFRERELKVSESVLKLLHKLNWSVVIQTMITEVLEDYSNLIEIMKDKVCLVPIVSPGLEKDWTLLERKKTTNPLNRIEFASRFKKKGFNVGINGEPFIPGFHEVKDFEDTVKLLKSKGITNYNTYNFHFNWYVAKRLAEINVDIERIWEYNQDINWKKILIQLIDISKKHGIVLGCPDFVNSGPYVESVNTCCGVNVENPTTFNIFTWKKRILKDPDLPKVSIFEESWDGVGDYEEGKKVFYQDSDKVFTLKDSLCEKKGLLF